MFDFEAFVKKVDDMRKAQREYYKARRAKLDAVAADWLSKSKQLEKEVDGLVESYLGPAHSEKLF